MPSRPIRSLFALFALCLATAGCAALDRQSRRASLGADAESGEGCKPVVADGLSPAEKDRLARCYAPTVYFHPEEKWFPMDPTYFVTHSRLRWAHDSGCPDHAIRNTVGTVDPTALGKAAYSASLLRDDCRSHYGGAFSSRRHTRPWDQGDKPQGEKPEGFFLDLDGSRNSESVRNGNAPPDPTAGGYTNAPRIYYTLKPPTATGTGYITYWLHYGYNRPAQSAAGVIDPHEGEWERVTVRLSTNFTLNAVAYYQHHCPSEIYTRSSPDRKDAQGNFLFTGKPKDVYEVGRLSTESDLPTPESTVRVGSDGPGQPYYSPVVYAANGSHASFPSASGDGTGQPREYKFPCPNASDTVNRIPAFDRVSGAGAEWKSYRSVGDITRQAWYGYGALGAR